MCCNRAMKQHAARSAMGPWLTTGLGIALLVPVTGSAMQGLGSGWVVLFPAFAVLPPTTTTPDAVDRALSRHVKALPMGEGAFACPRYMVQGTSQDCVFRISKSNEAQLLAGIPRSSEIKTRVMPVSDQMRAVLSGRGDAFAITYQGGGELQRLHSGAEYTEWLGGTAERSRAT